MKEGSDACFISLLFGKANLAQQHSFRAGHTTYGLARMATPKHQMNREKERENEKKSSAQTLNKTNEWVPSLVLQWRHMDT